MTDNVKLSDASGNLSRVDAIPLYSQLKQRLLAEIAEGKYAEGGILPTETQLCEIYAVSRITVRRAISELQDEKILEKRAGKGTFVSVQRLVTNLVKLNGFTETYTALGADPHSKLLSIETMPSDKATAQALGLKQGTNVLEVRRLILTRKGPLSIDQSYFELDRFPGLAEALHDDMSLYGLLRQKFGVQVTHSRRHINVRRAGHSDREVLACNLGEPLFDIEKIVYDNDMIPLQRSLIATPTNRITYTIDV
ncbi:UTRA domain-containing protein [Brucellaceae bacterium C25G]